jgi:hypothetical protein
LQGQGCGPAAGHGGLASGCPPGPRHCVSGPGVERVGSGASSGLPGGFTANGRSFLAGGLHLPTRHDTIPARAQPWPTARLPAPSVVRTPLHGLPRAALPDDGVRGSCSSRRRFSVNISSGSSAHRDDWYVVSSDRYLAFPPVRNIGRSGAPGRYRVPKQTSVRLVNGRASRWHMPAAALHQDVPEPSRVAGGSDRGRTRRPLPRGTQPHRRRWAVRGVGIPFRLLARTTQRG